MVGAKNNVYASFRDFFHGLDNGRAIQIFDSKFADAVKTNGLHILRGSQLQPSQNLLYFPGQLVGIAENAIKRQPAVLHMLLQETLNFSNSYYSGFRRKGQNC